MKKKIFGILLTVCLLISVFPITVFALAPGSQNIFGIEGGGTTYCHEVYFTVENIGNGVENLTVNYYPINNSDDITTLTPEPNSSYEYPNGLYKLEAGLGEIAIVLMYGDLSHPNMSTPFEVTVNDGHTDEKPKDHKCDFCDAANLGVCEDVSPKDHKCDYGCTNTFGTCQDINPKDHKCDYGCTKTFGTCQDVNPKDHKCDYGCGKTFGVCSGGTATCKNRAVCDYCHKPYGDMNGSNHAETEVRNDKAATCTEDGYTGDTYCKGCDAKLSTGTTIPAGHIDENNDYKCDICDESTADNVGAAISGAITRLLDSLQNGDYEAAVDALIDFIEAIALFVHTIVHNLSETFEFVCPFC